MALVFSFLIFSMFHVMGVTEKPPSVCNSGKQSGQAAWEDVG